VVGKLLGVTALGFYVMAYKLSNIPATGITHVFSQVAFPTYSKLQDDPKGLRNAYLKALKYIACISIPASGGLIVLAPEVVRFFLGERWMEIVPAMRILCIFGIIRALGGTTGPLFQGVGRPDIITKLNLGKLVIIGVLIVPLTGQFGILGTSLAVTIPMIMDQAVSWHICARIIRVKVRQIFSVVAPSFVGTLLMMGFLGLLKKVGMCPVDMISALCLVVSGGIFYFLFFWLFFKKEMIEIAGVVFSRVQKKRPSYEAGKF
jgi:O-antigen/teichoic acid export membrane protein